MCETLEGKHRLSPEEKAELPKGLWASCWICERVFQRKRETRRYCAKCDRVFVKASMAILLLVPGNVSYVG